MSGKCGFEIQFEEVDTVRFIALFREQLPSHCRPLRLFTKWPRLPASRFARASFFVTHRVRFDIQ